MASVPNMRLTPTLSPGPGDGSGEAGAAAGFARLLSALPCRTGEATILPAKGDAAEPEGEADEAETLSPADAILSLVGLAVPVPPASPASPPPPATTVAASAVESASAIGKAPGAAIAALHPQVMAGIVQPVAPAAVPAPATGADAALVEGDPDTMAAPAAPPPVAALADAGDAPTPGAPSAGSAPDGIGIDLQAPVIRPGPPRSTISATADETLADAEPAPAITVGAMRSEFAPAAAARIAARLSADAVDGRSPIAAKAGGTDAPIGQAVADPVETPAPGRAQAATAFAITPATLADPASSLAPAAPEPTADLPAPGEAAIERQLDVAADGEWLDQLARDIAGSGSEGRLRFRLNPETLGRLHVELTQTEHGASIRLTTESEAARALIADAQPRLMAEARAQGVRIAETHVDIGGGQAGDPRRNDPDRREPLIRTGGEDSHPAETADPRTPSGDRYA